MSDDREPHLNCRPIAATGQPHGLRKGFRWTCQCGKVWSVTRKDWTNVDSPDRFVCGCGWEYLTKVPYLEADITTAIHR